MERSLIITSPTTFPHHHHRRFAPATVKYTSTTRAVLTTTTTTPTTTNKPNEIVKDKETTQLPTSIPTPDKNTTTTDNIRNKANIQTRNPPSIAATVCNAMEGLINTFIDTTPRPSIDPAHVFSGNFAPVPELPPVACRVVKGSIPACLGGGAYIRNGPNPQHLPRSPVHLFDGDGMLHSILFPPGGGTAPATFTSRFVYTYKYHLERDAGAPVMPNPFGGFSNGIIPGAARGAVTAARVLTGQLNPLEGIGNANTNVFSIANRLFALGEADLPYAVHVSGETGEVSTISRCDFDGKLFMAMTAHPKKDPVTGEVFAFRYSPIPPFLTYFRFDPDGVKQPDVPIFSMKTPSFVHDFAITRRFAVFPDMQIMMTPLEMVTGVNPSPVGTDKGKVSRIGLLPRYAASEREMRWFEVGGFNPVHIVNAWEEDETVVVVAPNILSVEHALERMELLHATMEMIRINLRTGTVHRRTLSAGNLDFSVVNPDYIAKKSRYAYAGVGDPMPKISGVVKLDLECKRSAGECVIARRDFGPGCFGGEPYFVPDHENGGGEDDGYLVTYVHDEKKDESRFLVMDAKSTSELEIVAEVELPRRVPYGFHGAFFSQHQLNAQLPK